jgi:glycosyltransferase 2 family protein
MKNNFYKIILRFSGIIIMMLILQKIDFILFINHLTNINIKYFLLSILITIPLFITKIIRWKNILYALGIDCSIKDSIRVYGAGLFIGQITPGQIGEVVRGYLLSKKGYNLSKAIDSVLIDRLFDLAILVLISFVGLIYFLNLSSFFKICLVLTIIFFLKLLIHFSSYLNKINLDFNFFKILKRKIYSFTVQLRQIISSNSAMKSAASLTIISFIFTVVRASCILKSMNIKIPFFDLSFCISITNIVSLIPVSVAGIGTRDYTMIQIFSKYDLSSESAVTFSFLIFLVAYVLNLIWGFVAWFYETKQ